MKQKFCYDLDNSRKKVSDIKKIQAKRITMKYHLIKPKKIFLKFKM